MQGLAPLFGACLARVFRGALQPLASKRLPRGRHPRYEAAARAYLVSENHLTAEHQKNPVCGRTLFVDRESSGPRSPCPESGNLIPLLLSDSGYFFHQYGRCSHGTPVLPEHRTLATMPHVGM